MDKKKEQIPESQKVLISSVTPKTSGHGRVNHSKRSVPALAVTMEGQKELPGLWISQNEGAKL